MERVLALADRLRSQGIDAMIDRFMDAPSAGWPRWCAREIRNADFVLMVCTETYRRRVDLEEEPGKGHGVLWEARLINQELYDAGSVSVKFVPVLLAAGSPDDVPTPVRGMSIFEVETGRGFEGLCRLILSNPATPPLPLGPRKVWPRDAVSGNVAPLSAQVLGDYLAAFVNSMTKQNQSYLPLDAAVVPLDPSAATTSTSGLRRGYVQQVKRIIRLVSDTRSGGDLVNAQLAIVNRRSKIIRNVSRELMRAREPLVLLGDPGTGKSMTLREVAKDIALAQSSSRTPLVPVYLKLGGFCPRGNPTEQDVLAFIADGLPPAFQTHMEQLIHDKRLIVFFDGMDEMSRVQYGARVSALSDFAGTYQKNIKTIFSCRINDFSPEFVYRQIVLLPFDETQIRDFIAKNYGQSDVMVDNRRISKQRLYEVVVSEEWAQTLNVPQFLHLFIFFLKVRQAWPKIQEGNARPVFRG